VSELGRLVQAYRDRQKYPVADARIAAAIGVSRTSVGNWIKGVAVPSPENLRALAAEIETPYIEVFEAAMTDAGYLPERIGRPATIDAPDAPAHGPRGWALAAREGTPAHGPDGTTGEESQDREGFDPA
jgi:transcriptional regulator with XRE-family HTH domain